MTRLARAREKKQNTGQTFLQGALILSVAAVISKVVGALFKIPLQNIAGMVAWGHFETAYQFYLPIYTIAIAGLPLAVARMVSESIALERYRDVHTVYRLAIRIFLLCGVVGTLIMWFGADAYAGFVGMPESRRCIQMMAPTVFFSCLVSAHRGLYEGTRNMIPTAVSQIIESMGKLVLGVGLGYLALYWGQHQFAVGQPVFGVMAHDPDQALLISQPYVAVGAMAGVTIGSALAWVYTLWYHHRVGDGVTRQQVLAAPASRTNKEVFRALMAIAIPVTLGSLATQLTTLLDTLSLQRCLKILMEGPGGAQVLDMYRDQLQAARVDPHSVEDVLAWLTGNRGTAMTYVNIVPNITLTLGISALPVVTSAWTLKDHRQLTDTVESALRITLLLALPCGILLSVLGEPLMYFVYGREHISQVVGMLLAVLGVTTVFICLVAPVNAILQAVGRADLPVKIILAGGAIKLALNVALVLQPWLNVNGSSLSTLACYLVMVALSLRAVRKVVGVRLHWTHMAIKPLIAAVICGGTAFGLDRLLEMVMSRRLSTLVACIIAAIVYLIVLILIRAFTKDDILMLPKGKKIAKVLEKYGKIG
ncbi:MAG: putative polysaccharide biosynthesis protein [Acutalibacteraceae bacterium]|jgi:stage V sporulation protein B